MTTFTISLPTDVDRDQVLRNLDGGNALPVVVFRRPEEIARSGQAALGFAMMAAPSAADPWSIDVEVDWADGSPPAVKFLVADVARNCRDQVTGAAIGSCIQQFLAELDEDEDQDDDDVALDTDGVADPLTEPSRAVEEAIGRGNLIPNRRPPAAIGDYDVDDEEAAPNPTPAVGDDEEAAPNPTPLRQRGFPTRSQHGRDEPTPRATRRGATIMYEDDDNLDGADAAQLRALIAAEPVPGDANPNVAQRAIALVMRLQPTAKSLGEVELARLAATLLRSAGLSSAERVLHVDVHSAVALGRLTNPRSVPLSTTSSGGARSTVALDLRGIRGRNRLERAIGFLEHNRPGFRELDWDQKVVLGSELLQTAPSVIDDGVDPIAEHRARSPKRTY